MDFQTLHMVQLREHDQDIVELICISFPPTRPLLSHDGRHNHLIHKSSIMEGLESCHFLCHGHLTVFGLREIEVVLDGGSRANPFSYFLLELSVQTLEIAKGVFGIAEDGYCYPMGHMIMVNLVADVLFTSRELV